MLTYNTQLKRLTLPEYGRNIQQMIDHCLTIEDRDERTYCAYCIVDSMATLFPAMKETEEGRHKLWDHLNIMAGFQLDIEWPCEVINADDISTTPQKVPYPGHPIRYRHYGRSIEEAIAQAIAMEPGAERDALVMLIANHMKKLQLAINPDGVQDEKIFRDLAEYSHGEIRLSPETTQLRQFQIVTPPKPTRRRRRK